MTETINGHFLIKSENSKILIGVKIDQELKIWLIDTQTQICVEIDHDLTPDF